MDAEDILHQIGRGFPAVTALIGCDNDGCQWWLIANNNLYIFCKAP